MKKQERNFIMYLEDIFEGAKSIEKYVESLTVEKFETDQKTQDAVIMRIGIIGEAVKNLPTAVKKKHTQINWKRLVKMRNILVHEYFGINLKRVWKTVKEDLPDLKQKI